MLYAVVLATKAGSRVHYSKYLLDSIEFYRSAVRCMHPQSSFTGPGEIELATTEKTPI
jgi:hypothetical protein